MTSLKNLLIPLFLSLPICGFALNPPNTTAEEVQAQKTEFTIKVSSQQASQFFSGSIFVDGKMIKVEERTPYKLKLKAQSVRFILGTDEFLPRLTVSIKHEGGIGSEATGHVFYDCAESTLSRQEHLKRYGHSVCEGSMAG